MFPVYRTLFEFSAHDGIPFDVIAHVNIDTYEVVSIEAATPNGGELTGDLLKRVEEQAVEEALRDYASDGIDNAYDNALDHLMGVEPHEI